MRIITRFLTFCGVLAAANLNALDGKVLVTKAQNIADQWTGILPGRPPVIPLCIRVVPLEPFHVNAAIVKPAVKNGQARVSGTLKFRNSAGKILHESKLRPLEFKCDNPNSVFLFNEEMLIAFEKSDADGTYTFSAEFTDENDNAKAKAEAAVKLTRTLPPPDPDPYKALLPYYRHPAPQNVIPAYRALLAKALPAMKKKQGKNYYPWSPLALFYYILAGEPELHEAFAKEVAAETDAEAQTYGAAILHELGAKAFELLPDRAKKRWNPRLLGVFHVEKPEFSFQLDTLWSEFLVRGNKQPLVKIVGVIKKMEHNLSIQDFKKLSAPTPRDRQSLSRYVTGLSAMWSVSSNAKQHPLARYYLEAMLRRKEIADPFTQAMVAKAIGMKVKTAPGTASAEGKTATAPPTKRKK